MGNDKKDVMAGGVAEPAVQSIATLVVCREANQSKLRADGVRGPGLDLGGGCGSMKKKRRRREGVGEVGGLLGNDSWITTSRKKMSQ